MIEHRDRPQTTDRGVGEVRSVEQLSPCAHEELATPESAPLTTYGGDAPVKAAIDRQAAAAVDDSTSQRYAGGLLPVKLARRPVVHTLWTTT